MSKKRRIIKRPKGIPGPKQVDALRFEALLTGLDKIVPDDKTIREDSRDAGPTEPLRTERRFGLFRRKER